MPQALAGTFTLHEIRLAGRGGQGVVTAGELLGRAAVGEGRFAQSIPTFGPERRGALSSAVLRLSGEEILLKCSAARPDVVLVLDPTIWHHANVFGGARPDATLILNTPDAPADVALALESGRYGYRMSAGGFRVLTVDATGLAMEILGRPITNTAMMGAFAGATGLIAMASVEDALVERFGVKGEANVRAARVAAERLRAS